MKEIAITENHLYQKAYKNGERAVSRNVAVYILRDYTAKRQMLKNPQKEYINRVGISVSKKLGGAVERNRIKRLIRAGFANAKAHKKMKTGYLIVIAGRFGAEKANSDQIARELIGHFEKLRMYIPEDNREEKI